MDIVGGLDAATSSEPAFTEAFRGAVLHHFRNDPEVVESIQNTVTRAMTGDGGGQLQVEGAPGASAEQANAQARACPRDAAQDASQRPAVSRVGQAATSVGQAATSKWIAAARPTATANPYVLARRSWQRIQVSLQGPCVITFSIAWIIVSGSAPGDSAINAVDIFARHPAHPVELDLPKGALAHHAKLPVGRQPQ